MVSLALSSIVMTFSISSFSHIQQKEKLNSDINSFIRLIDLARTSAIEHRSLTRICPIASDSSCGGTWQNIQLIVSPDKDSNKIGELIFNTQYSKIEWRAFQNKNHLSFTNLGFTDHQNGTLYLCHKDNSELNRSIAISKSGRATVKSNSSKLSQVCA